MQVVSTALEAMIDGGINANPNDVVWDWAQCYEVYSVDAAPPFDPSLAVARFSDIKLTWGGNVYLRYVKDRGDIERSVGTDFNNVNINFSNITRYMATLFNTDVLTEGMHVVIRLVSRSITDSSIVLFTGRLDNPNDTTEETLPVVAKQHGSVDYEVPKRSYDEDDPEGRLPNDIDYQGFRFIPSVSSFDEPASEPVNTTSFFGLIHHTHTRNYFIHRQYSSQDATPYGDAVRESFGQVQAELTPITWVRTVGGINGLWVADGSRIASFVNLRCVTDGFLQPDNVTEHHGFLSSEIGDNATPDPLFPNSGTFSGTAYVGLGVETSTPDASSSVPTIVSVLLGRTVAQWDALGNLIIIDWSDNPADIAREILTHADFIGLPQAFIDDEWYYKTKLICDQPLLDTSNGERVFIPTDQLPNVGVTFDRFHSTGRQFSWWYYRRIDPYDSVAIDNYLDLFDTFDPADPPVLTAPVPVLRRKWTCNVTLTDRVKVVDFLFNTILPSFRGYLTIGSNGKIQIKTEQPADSSLLTTSTIIGDTELPIADIAPWIESFQGEALIGVSLLASEHIKVIDYKYSAAGNSIPITRAVTGTITAALSSATLTGGTDSIAPSVTVTIGGTISAGDEVVVTIDGIQSAYLITATDSIDTVAGVLTDTINAHPTLNRYVEAVWDLGHVITVKSKLGSLVLESALANAHTGPLANPVAGPTLASSTGLLGAGVYLVAYTYVTDLGETNLSPATSITLIADKQIDVTTISLPAGVNSINWYVSTVPDSTVLSLAHNNNGAGFSINSLPLTTAQPTPAWNTTGEEVIRIAMAFDASNIVEKSFKWPLRGNQTSYNQFTMKFRDASHDFGEATYKLRSKPHIQKVRKVNNLDMDGSAVDNWNQAVRLVRSKAAKELDGAPEVGKPTYFYQLTSRGRPLLLEEGDVVCLTDDTGGTGDTRFVNVPARIEKVSISNNLEVTITCRAYSTNMFSDHVVPRNVVLPSSVSPPTPSDGHLSLTLTGGTRTLTNDEATFRIIDVSGTLVSNEIIVFPAIARQWTITNSCTGAFTLTCKTAAQTTGIPTIAQGTTVLIECDGTDIRRVSSSDAAANVLEEVDAGTDVSVSGISGKHQTVNVDSDVNATASKIVKRDGSGNIKGVKVLASSGIGVGNSASATTPGTVVKKVEVFDASGASLGYLPVYDAIT